MISKLSQLFVRAGVCSKINITLTLLLVCSFAIAQQDKSSQKPNLIVFVSVEGMKTDHLTKMWDRFGADGLKKIMQQGVVVENVFFNYISKSSCVDIASIFSGTTPSQHGIIDRKVYSLKAKDLVSVVAEGDGKQKKNSPQKLLTTNLADAIKLNNNKSKVFAFGLNPENAMLMAGHCADAAIWIDNNGTLAAYNGKNNMPNFWTKNIDRLMPIYLQNSWKSKYSISSYIYLPSDSSNNGVFYSADPKNRVEELVDNFRRTPAANSVMNQLAINAIKNEDLGKDSNTDLLCINFNIIPLRKNSCELNSAESEDMYLNLDTDIKFLLDAIEQHVGIGKTLVVLSGTQANTVSMNSLANNNFATGRFEGKRSISLLNTYLMAKFGQGRWILNYSAGNVVLNAEYAKEKQIDFEKIKTESAAFIASLYGVQATYTDSQIKNICGDATNLDVRLKNSYCNGVSGHVFVVLRQGFIDYSIDMQQSELTTSGMQYTPLLMYGCNLKKLQSQQLINATDIVPTICQIGKIPLTESSTGRPLYLTE